MHHKFLVIDGRLLITGSFNWTRQAIIGNNENLVITDHADLVSAYCQEFDRLWQTFDPKHYLVPHMESKTNYS
jgi:cardiolipin hydrolase